MGAQSAAVVHLARQTAPEVQKRVIYFARERIGEAETLSEPISTGGARVRSRILMHMRAFGLPALIVDDRTYMSSDVRLDSGFQLAESRMNGQFQAIPTYTVQTYPNFYDTTYRTKVYGWYGLTPGEIRRIERRR